MGIMEDQFYLETLLIAVAVLTTAIAIIAIFLTLYMRRISAVSIKTLHENTDSLKANVERIESHLKQQHDE